MNTNISKQQYLCILRFGIQMVHMTVLAMNPSRYSRQLWDREMQGRVDDLTYLSQWSNSMGIRELIHLFL